ncbi:hypothetical protein I3843_03G081500 [Carya illinoinensis]|uniref:Uncharacterized protein n=1 Tax=Carya illinoinensis TaxID=32201 RepID=A0A922FEZ6_CARIL|nr:hypothetical protein I3760_03G078700 [Carya illinoinensis]KAG6720824.1 hypothetical protein I3842_03G081500 [Carya illinoinensis]KAG7986461.1 hypothetical protein I3843_03G081500 [Carya illinoinensis]
MEVRAVKKVTLLAFLLFIIMLMAPPINGPDHGATASTLMKENNGTTIRCINGFLDECLLAHHDYLDLEFMMRSASSSRMLRQSDKQVTASTAHPSSPAGCGRLLEQGKPYTPCTPPGNSGNRDCKKRSPYNRCPS